MEQQLLHSWQSYTQTYHSDAGFFFFPTMNNPYKHIAQTMLTNAIHQP